MARVRFQSHRFSSKMAALVEQADAIITEYQEADLRLTLRQLYYQLVSRGLVENTEREYKRVSRVLSDARRAGLVDWAMVEDRTRRPVLPAEFEDLDALVAAALAAFRLPRWRGQAHYVELWVEKDALAGVLAPLADEFHVTLQVNRGYSSDTALYDAARRITVAGESGKRCVLLYLGDLDPSGEDMVRDLSERLTLFRAEVEVRKLALTPAQVREYTPPPNSAKCSDSRAVRFIAEHGEHSYEVDALRPDLLADLVRGAVRECLDPEPFRRIIEQEERDKSRLRRMTAGQW